MHAMHYVYWIITFFEKCYNHKKSFNQSVKNEMSVSLNCLVYCFVTIEVFRITTYDAVSENRNSLKVSSLWKYSSKIFEMQPAIWAVKVWDSNHWASFLVTHLLGLYHCTILYPGWLYDVMIKWSTHTKSQLAQWLEFWDENQDAQVQISGCWLVRFCLTFATS